MNDAVNALKSLREAISGENNKAMLAIASRWSAADESWSDEDIAKTLSSIYIEALTEAIDCLGKLS